MSKKDNYSYCYLGTRISLDAINVLPQSRKTFQEIELLAEDIAAKKLMNPILVARFNQEICEQYLKTINHLWKTTYQIQNLISVNENKGETIFYILIAGERRLKACRYLQKFGCERCREKNNSLQGCYQYHFGDQMIEARLCLNIPPLKALLMQASENIHMRVPPHEEARFYSELFQLIRLDEPKYSLSRLARDVGRSPETIREALKFCLLPEETQNLVAKKMISYGIACEIAKLQVAGVNEKELQWWVLRAISGNYKVPEFQNMVTNLLRDRANGELKLFTEQMEKEMKDGHIRLIAQQQMITAIWSWLGYFSRINSLFLEGKLGQKDSPFSEQSPLRIFRKLIEEEKKLLPHLKNLLKNKECQDAQRVIEETEKSIKP